MTTVQQHYMHTFANFGFSFSTVCVSPGFAVCGNSGRVLWRVVSSDWGAFLHHCHGCRPLLPHCHHQEQPLSVGHVIPPHRSHDSHVIIHPVFCSPKSVNGGSRAKQRKELRWVRFKTTTLCSVGRVLYPLSYHSGRSRGVPWVPRNPLFCRFARMCRWPRARA